MHSHVHRILVNEENQAYGVLLQRKNKMYEILARKEVVLSAGAIGSPQILMLSGIGPADHLRELGPLSRHFHSFQDIEKTLFIYSNFI